MPLISITRLRIRSWRFLPAFVVYALRSSRQARRAEGNLAVNLLNDAHRTFWTASLWTDEAAMKRFMISGAHGKAMRKLLNWCDEAALVHWTQDEGTLPSWLDAHSRLQAEGRPSKVRYASPAHVAHRFPAPRVATISEVRLK